MSIVRILIWNLADSKTTLGELRPQERFGLVSTGEAVPDLQHLRELIDKEPDIAEEFDALE